MPRIEWTPEEEAELCSCVRAGMIIPELIERWATSGRRRTYRSFLNKIKRMRAQGVDCYAQVPVSTQSPFTKQIVATGDFLLLFDLHVPFHSSIWVNRIVGLALRWGITQLGIGGDLTDMAAFSPFGKQFETDAEEEMVAAETVLTRLSRSFEKVIYVPGNHEMRMLKLLGRGLPVTRLMEMWVKSQNVEVSEYRWFDLVSGNEKFRVEHQRNYSRIPTSVALKLVHKFHMHVITSHAHLNGMRRDEGNRYWAIDCGMCADERRIDYVNLVHNTNPRMLLGAVVIMDGIPILLCPSNIAFFERLGTFS